MVTLAEIKSGLQSNSADDKSGVDSFEEILKVLRLYLYPVDQLNFLLQAVESILPIAEGFDSENASVWARWTSTIKAVRHILNQSSIAASPLKTFHIHDAYTKAYPFACCLIAKSEKEIHSRLIPAKALLLIAHYLYYQEGWPPNRFQRSYHNSREHISSKEIMSSIISKSSVYDEHVKKMLPPWPNSSLAQWRELFLENSKDLPKDESHKGLYGHVPDQFVFIRTLRRVLDATTCGETNPPREQEPPPPEDPPHEQGARTSVITQPPADHKSLSPRNRGLKRPSFTYFKKPTPEADSNSDGLAPKVIYVAPQAETPSDQPTQLSAVQSHDVRYSNYRTAMDNQRLPWQWDCLNAHEIKAVRAALLASSKKPDATISEKHGAFIVWLLLATGQTIEEILHFGLGRNQSNQNTIVAGPIYIRRIVAPPHSFVPDPEQQSHLNSHSPSVSLTLPRPFPTLVTELGLIDSNISLIKGQPTIGSCLNLDIEQAETAARLFLENYRTRSFRLLPGRIRNALSKEIMRVTNDPVATHVLSGLPTDTPPSGVYYTSYSKERLEDIYAEAVASMFGGAE